MEVLIIADQDDSGSVDIPELMAAIINLNAIITLQQQKEIFEQFDDDKSASLDLKEVHLLFKSKLLKKYVPKHQISELMKDIDLNGDNELDFEEF